jgi:surface protein
VVGAKLKRLRFRGGGFSRSCLGSIINPTNLRTQSITDMSNMFNGSKLVSLDVSSWDTSNVTNMRAMFQTCWALETINTDSWDVSKVTNMSDMFFFSQLITSDATEAWWDGSNPQITSYASAFGYNTARANYASIPAGWK